MWTNSATGSPRFLSIKVAVHKALAVLRIIVAEGLRHVPGSWSLLGIPGQAINSLKCWIATRREAETDRWRNTRGPHYERLLEAIAVRGPTLRTIDGKVVPTEFTRDQHMVYAELFLAVLPGARVLGPNGTVITPDGRVVSESTWPRCYLPGERAWTALWLPRCQKLAGRYYSIASPHWSGYYHWVTDVLPRLYALDTLVGDDIRILVNAPLNAWQRESLELLGYDVDRFLPVGDGYFQAEVLYLPSYLGDPSPHPFACHWLRERLLPADAPARGSRRLYVTRRLARCRRLVNEHEIEPILQDSGFEIVEAERLTFREQVSLFSQAEFVIGPHGAGLTNILFAPERCRVLELFQPTYFHASTYKRATCLNHDYGFLAGKPVLSATSDSANTTDIQVDKDQFEACLSAMDAMPRHPTLSELPRGLILSQGNGCGDARRKRR